MYKYSPDTEVEAVCCGVSDGLQVPCKLMPAPCEKEKLEQVLFVSQENLVRLMGDLGRHLQSFVSSVSVNHPSLGSVSVLQRESKFVSILGECCEFAQLASEGRFTSLCDIIRKDISNSGCKDSLLWLLRKPPISLLADPTRRNELRNLIVAKSLDIKSSSDCEDYFCLLPKTFLPYVRNGNGFSKEIEANGSTAALLSSIGLKCQTKALQTYNEQLKAATEDTCYGFVRLSILQASIILAKTLGVEYSNNEEHLVVPPARFRDLKVLYREEEPCYYQPRIYPLSKVPFAKTKYVEDLISTLESYPPIGNFPVFDNYYVVVPSVKIPINTENKPYLKDNGSIKYFDTVNDAWYYFYKKAVQSGAVTPVILGDNRMEQVGKCYFISYWI